MLGTSMTSSEIDIAKYLARLERAGMATPLVAIQSCATDLAKEIKVALSSKETLATTQGQAPTLEHFSTECYMWAVAILASAWTEWVFTAKSNDKKYQQDPKKREAAINVKIALPYIRNSITDAMSKASEIGSRTESNYRPENTTARMELTK